MSWSGQCTQDACAPPCDPCAPEPVQSRVTVRRARPILRPARRVASTRVPVGVDLYDLDTMSDSDETVDACLIGQRTSDGYHVIIRITYADTRRKPLVDRFSIRRDLRRSRLDSQAERLRGKIGGEGDFIAGGVDELLKFSLSSDARIKATNIGGRNIEDADPSDFVILYRRNEDDEWQDLESRYHWSPPDPVTGRRPRPVIAAYPGYQFQFRNGDMVEILEKNELTAFSETETLTVQQVLRSAGGDFIPHGPKLSSAKGPGQGDPELSLIVVGSPTARDQRILKSLGRLKNKLAIFSPATRGRLSPAHMTFSRNEGEWSAKVADGTQGTVRIRTEDGVWMPLKFPFDELWGEGLIEIAFDAEYDPQTQQSRPKVALYIMFEVGEAGAGADSDVDDDGA